MNNQDNGMAARHSSETAEHYTPGPIVEAARATLGEIDFDPFSCTEANDTVRAVSFASLPLCDGYRGPWLGRIFCNPPGGKSDGQSNQKRAWQKLVRETDAGNVTAAVFMCFSLEMLQTTQVKAVGRLPLDFPICYPSRRIAYRKPGGATGKSPPHSSCVILVPISRYSTRPGDIIARDDMICRFRAAFGVFGKVVVPT